MKSLLHTSLGAIVHNEVLFNSKRIAPYAMAILFGGNALLWWGWGPAAGRGWATNSDNFIAGVMPVYSFMTLPLFTVLLMADPVIRDFRIGVAPLIFSKPVSRAEYLLGKFFANFLVLVCCQSAFAITLFSLQAFKRPGMLVQEMQVLPYIKHFGVFVVISHLVLASIYFMLGTLTRNAKIVYGLGVSFYPLYIGYQGVLKSLPPPWRVVLDPLLMNWGKISTKGQSAEWLNQMVVVYDSDLIINRVGMILIAAICLTVVYFRFVLSDRRAMPKQPTLLGLSLSSERASYEIVSAREISSDLFPGLRSGSPEAMKPIAAPGISIPTVHRSTTGLNALVDKLIGALNVEFNLLRTERSLVVILPLVALLSFLSLPFHGPLSDETYSASFASSTASGLLIFLVGVIVFYTGEGMRRDREARIEPVLWSTPAPNSVFLLSKFIAISLLAILLIVVGGLTAIATQLFRGQTPIELSAYLITYSVILFPSIAFVTAAAITLNVLLRDKYLTYAACIATCGGLFYVYSQGYKHWLYNPLLYDLWRYGDLVGEGNNQARILVHRIYCLAVGGVCLAFAHVFFRRNSTKGMAIGDWFINNRGAILMMFLSAVIAIMAGLAMASKV